MKCLNLGCGHRYHPEWTNIDFYSSSQFVISHNLLKSIPVSDESFHIVYHSHVLEHLPKSYAPKFLQECYRILQPQGVIRIVVPDLEQIIRSYIFFLDQALSGSQEASDSYNWLLLELFDQIVRNKSGGNMATYLYQPLIPNETFIINRLGTEAKNLIQSGKQQRQIQAAVKVIPENRFLETIIKPFYRFFRYPSFRQDWLLKKILGNEFETLELGRFRQSGEIHQWMYDRFSLSKLLEEAGFTQIVQRSATESYVSNWVSFNLDTEADGSVYKPDSLFMEAIKPSK